MNSLIISSTRPNSRHPIGNFLKSLAIATALIGAAPFHASAVSIRLESGALGLASNVYINWEKDGNPADPNQPGKLSIDGAIGSGVGSSLWVQTNGLAGQGTLLNPLFVTITAKSHLDNTGVVPLDYTAGILCLTSGTGGNPTDLGLGVRAFTVDSNGNRQLNAATQTYLIEGSKEVSGGTDPCTWNANKPPHVDEIVNFNFAKNVLGTSIVVTLTKFDGTGTGTTGLNGSEDIVDIVINRVSGAQIDLKSLRKSANPNLFTAVQSYNDVYNLNFSAIPGLLATDIVTSFGIRANDDNPSSPQGTAEHFLINGLTATIAPATVPDGGFTRLFLGLSTLGLLFAAHTKSILHPSSKQAVQ